MTQVIVLLTFLCFMSIQSFAAQEAIVYTPAAIIFADQQMSAAIGYLPKGKKVMVGEVKRNKGRVLPIVVSGKVAYIQVKDIITSEAYKDLNVSANQRIKRVISKSKRNSSFEFGHVGSASIHNLKHNLTNKETDEVYAVGVDKDFQFSGFFIRGHKRHSDWNKTRFSFESLSGSYDDLDIAKKEVMQIVSMNIDKVYTLINFERFKIGALIGASLIPYASYRVDSDFKLSGNGWGAYVGLEMELRVTDRVSLFIEGSSRSTQIGSFERPKNLNKDIEILLTQNIFNAGLAYNF